MTRTPKKVRSVGIHIHGNAAHNVGILAAIGGLVVNWGNNESVFLAMLQTLVKGAKLTAAIIWQSQKTSRPRLDLVARLAREQIKDAKLIEDIEEAIHIFSGLSRARNFYCHATYDHRMPDGAIIGASAMTLSEEGDPLRSETKHFDAGIINEINDTSMRLALLNRELWNIVIRMQDALGVQLVRLPQWPGEDPQPPASHPPKNGGASPPEPPEQSQG